MTETSPENAPDTPEKVLARIHAALKDKSAQTRLAAIQELQQRNYSSPAILQALEVLALNDKSKSVRETARQALDTSTHRFIQRKTSKLHKNARENLLKEITAWEIRGLISADQATVLRKRYDFDLKPVPPLSGPEPAAVPPAAPAPTSAHAPAQPTAPRQTLAQSLLSETSIKIALYLGAFFVIAAAAILAAVVEAARLPILLATTTIFGGGAIVLKKRLPQPSFALFVVFSFLLPTDANVLAEVLHLSTRVNAGYWFAALGGMALIWGFGAWFYASRLFSLASFVSLAASFGRFGEFLDTEPEILVLLFSAVVFLGLGGVYLLKRWKDEKLGLPLFVLVQVSQGALIIFALIVVGVRASEYNFSAWQVLTTFFWPTTAAFYFLSNLIFPFVFFPWLAAVVLYPVPLNFTLAFDAELPLVSAVTWFWGLCLALAGDGLRRLFADKYSRYSLPLLATSLPIILTAAVAGFAEEALYGFACLLAGAILYALVHLLKPRVHVWTASLVLGLGAYFAFFTLPFMKNQDVFIGFQFLGGSLLLLVPDLFLKPTWKDSPSWRWPPRLIGAGLLVINTSILIGLGIESPGNAAICYGIYALFVLLYALRLDKPRLGYFGTAFASLTIVFALNHFDLDAWLPALTGLAVVILFGGRGLHERGASIWSRVMRLSGLALGAIIGLVALFIGRETGGWYILLIGAMFVVEMFACQNGWWEAGAQFFFPAALFLLFSNFDVSQVAYYLLGISLLWLTLDLILMRTFHAKRPLSWPARILGWGLTAVNTIGLLISGANDSQTALISFGIYTLFFLPYALVFDQPLLGFGTTVFSNLSLVYALRVFEQPKWFLPAIALGTLYYLTGFIWRRRTPENKWPLVLWTSGLGVSLLATLVAPFQDGLAAAIPAAVTATMVTAEAFERRNVWLGFPANALYLLSYFLILDELNINEPQFYSIAIAALGLLMHYLLTHTGSKTGAFITGMVSQLVLLGATYSQLLSSEKMGFFAVLFFQALAVLIYGIVIRSRSLVITPILFAVLSVITVLFGLLQGIGTIIMIGCTGILLILLGILAIVLRERIKEIGERFSNWTA